MKDTELQARLIQLGMRPDKARALTVKIRDQLHPVAAVAVAKLRANSGGLGSLGLAKAASTGITDASMGAKAGSMIVPGIGTAVGAAVGLVIGVAMTVLKKQLGKASKGWNDIVARRMLQQLNGRDFDERTWSEGFKGMMDEGNNIIRGCGTDRHKNPDCFCSPLAKVIIQGYTSGRVPLSASTLQVYQQVVVPWLQSGGGAAQVNWGTLANEPTQQAMIMSAVDRYLAGLPIVRCDMPSYKGETTDPSFRVPDLVTALTQAGLLSSGAASANVSTQAAQSAQIAAPPAIVQQARQVALQVAQQGAPPALVTPVYQASSTGVLPFGPAQGYAQTTTTLTPTQDATAGVLQSLISQQGANMVSPPAQALVADVAATGVQQTGALPAPSSASKWAIPAAIAAGGILLEHALKK